MIKKFENFRDRAKYYGSDSAEWVNKPNGKNLGFVNTDEFTGISSDTQDISNSIESEKFESDKRRLQRSFKELSREYKEFVDKYNLKEIDKDHVNYSISTIVHMGNSIINLKKL